ncbi:hypothetical protein BH11PLA2_BH11PLA2_16300 [soil metagenome]
MSLGIELRKARLAAGLTQEKLAFSAGLDRAYISQLENDHKSPTVDVLYMICDALSVAASDLLAGVERTRQRSRKADSANQTCPP